ncbi:MAG: CNNM domain-containing protein [Gammaproteobacteria bacterium]|nr:CNNM domain-containing protein [Gammaproteobacteria bacterium]
MSLNRYRLRHHAKEGIKGAIRAQALLQRPDRLIGLILLFNNFVNILASVVATIIALRLLGEQGLAIATGILTFVILIFAELTPKTLATVHTERIAYLSAHIYTPTLIIFSPLVSIVNFIANNLLRLIKVSPQQYLHDNLSRDELRTVLAESAQMIPPDLKEMLLQMLDLESIAVEEIMVPKSDIVSIDLSQSLKKIAHQIASSPHSHLAIYKGDIDENFLGFVNLRKLINFSGDNELSREHLESQIQRPYFIPESTPLAKQLENFSNDNYRIGLVINEYGKTTGLITVEDILEEIIGGFTSMHSFNSLDVGQETQNSYLVDGDTLVRTLNRKYRWKLPTRGAKTISGLLLEELKTLPTVNSSVQIGHYSFEVLKTEGNAVKAARITLLHPSRSKEQNRTGH